MFPKKLKDDSIVEAICHLHFASSEVSEIVVGRLSDDSAWDTFTRQRLPVADIPAPVRNADENLRFEPLLQLKSEKGDRLVKIGDKTISYHITGRYCGWTVFEKELERVFKELFTKLRSLKIERIGFRYINALTRDRHFISDINTLKLNIIVADELITSPFNLNYQVKNSEEHYTMTRIASPDFVKGATPQSTSAVVDVDVFTPPEFATTKKDELSKWVQNAHLYEKEAFFKLIPENILDNLRED